MVIPVQTSYIYSSYVVDAYVDFFMKTEFNGVVISVFAENIRKTHSQISHERML